MIFSKVLEGDMREELALLPENSVAAVITDPPYGLEFMGKGWDKGVPGVDFWSACLRILMPGGYLLAFGGTRTHHRLWCAVEDAGFELRDTLLWLYGQGFPKSLDVSKAIDKAAKGHPQGTANPDSPGHGKYKSSEDPSNPTGRGMGAGPGRFMREQASGPSPAITDPAAKQWEGWGTALKPAWEPILLARKPLSEPTVAANVLKWGTGALAIDATRIGYQDEADKASATPQGRVTSKESESIGAKPDAGRNLERIEFDRPEQKGRWPASVLLDEEAAVMLDEQTGILKSGMMKPGQQRQQTKGGGGYHGDMPDEATAAGTYGDAGGASRFFYCPKASKKERGKGNKHPTVKPLALMRWLIRLVTPPGGIVVDPFCGSGSTLVAAAQESFDSLGIDIDASYCTTARQRLKEQL